MKKLFDEKGEFGIGVLISIATALIVAAFVLVPGVRDFAGTVMDGMDTWWSTNIAPTLFPSI